MNHLDLGAIAAATLTVLVVLVRALVARRRTLRISFHVGLK